MLLKTKLKAFFAVFFFACTCLLASPNGSGGSIFDQARKVTDNAQNYLSRARSIFNDVQGSQAYQDLVQGKTVDLPIKIPYNQQNSKIRMELDSVVMTPEKAYAVVFMMLDTKVFSANSNTPPLYFAATDIGFTKTGGFTGDASVFLLDSVPIQMGNSTTLTILSKNPFNNKPTYATFDCEGFKELHLSGKITFSKDLMQQEGANGKVNGQAVSVFFETTITDWDDWIIEINKIPAFQVVQLPGFSWSVQSFVLDKSLTRNSLDFRVPALYDMTAFGGMPEMWNGVYFKNITVKLPKEIKKKSSKSTDRITIQGNSFLVDKTGLTGEALALDLIKDGEIGRWTYTVDTIGIRMIRNTISYVGFGGTMDMPLAKATKDGRLGLKYHTSLTLVPNTNETQYNFHIQNTDSLEFSFFKVAKVQNLIAQFDIRASSGSFKAEGVFTGNLVVTPMGATSATVFDVRFEKMRIRSYQSYWGGVEKVQLAVSGSGEKSLFAKLPVKIDSVGVLSRNQGDRLGLKFVLSVNLMKSDGEDAQTSNSFGGGATVTVWANHNNETNKWSYHSIEVSTIKIKVDNPGFKLEGEVSLYNNDPKYGEGFYGRLKAEFKPGIEVKVAAMFGRYTSDVGFTQGKSPEDIVAGLQNENVTYRYWVVDAFVKLPSAIPIFTGIGINAFAGGAYHHMVLNGKAMDCTSGLGCSANGQGRFEPSDKIYLGVRAGVGIVSMPTNTVFSGNLLFGIEFLKTGGVEKIYFDGNAKFLTPQSVVSDESVKGQAGGSGSSGGAPADCEGGVSAKWHTEYNFTTKTFSGTFTTLMELGFIKGTYPGCKVGDVEVYFSPSDWYFYVGRPVTPLSVEFVGLLTINGYLVTGSVLPRPAMAPLPAGFRSRDLDGTLLPSGGGVGFGVRARSEIRLEGSFDMKGCSVGGGVNAGFEVGTDVLIAKDKSPVNCSGYNPRGINNWYATGRAYVWFWGDIFISYSCLGASGSTKLVTLDFKADVFAQLPRPTYMEGEVKARGEVIGIGVTAKFDFKYGDVCGSEDLREFELVQRVFPSDLTDTLNVYTAPSVELKMGVGSQFSYQGNQVTVGTPSFIVKAIKNGTETTIPGKVKLNNSKTQITFEPDRVLPENSRIEIRMTIQMGAAKAIEKTWGFSTIKEREDIEITNVAYGYPLPQMQNVYPKTGSEGYIKLRTLPAKPMSLPANYKFEVRYIQGSDTVFKGPVTVRNTTADEQFSYAFPSDKLKPNTNYKFQIAKTPTVRQADQRNYSSTGTDVGVSGGSTKLEDIVIVEYTFTTSKFMTFEEKMAAFANGSVEMIEDQGIVKVNMNQQTESGAKLLTERFTFAELEGYQPEVAAAQQLPLIRMVSEPVYSGGFQTNLDNQFIPLATPYRFTYPIYDNVRLESAANGYSLNYEVAHEVLERFAYLRQQGTTGSDLQNSLQGATGDRNVVLKQGTYVVNCKYYLPGRTSASAQYNLKFETTKDISYR